MKKVKSRDEILQSPYVTKTEVKRLIGGSYATASKIYAMALKKDQEELAGRLIYENGEKVRLTSVQWATGCKLKSRKA